MRYCITIKGRVQGVYFRQFTLESALELGVRGFVCNQQDGSVYCEAEGDEASLQQFLDCCGNGSPYSDVKSVEVNMADAIGFEKFEIRR